LQLIKIQLEVVTWERGEGVAADYFEFLTKKSYAQFQYDGAGNKKLI
jgi:hypothetical protein